MSMASEDFSARIARINAGGSNTKGTIFVGMDQTFQMPRKMLSADSHSRGVGQGTYNILALVVSLLLGMIGVAAARYLRFAMDLEQGLDLNADMEMLVNGGAGMVIALILTQVLRLQSKEHLGMQAAGAFAMVCAFHNLVHWSPSTFASVFSQEWVAQILEATDANTILFRGINVLASAST